MNWWFFGDLNRKVIFPDQKIEYTGSCRSWQASGEGGDLRLRSATIPATISIRLRCAVEELLMNMMQEGKAALRKIENRTNVALVSAWKGTDRSGEENVTIVVGMTPGDMDRIAGDLNLALSHDLIVGLLGSGRFSEYEDNPHTYDPTMQQFWHGYPKILDDFELTFERHAKQQ